MAQRVLRLLALVALTVACDARGSGLIGVNPPATKIGFTSQPSNVVVGAAIAPAVQVAVQNGQGQTVSSSQNVSITITLVAGTGTTGAVLTGGTAQVATNGIANFTNLRIDLAGTGYQILAAASGFSAVSSTPFNVTP